MFNSDNVCMCMMVLKSVLPHKHRFPVLGSQSCECPVSSPRQKSLLLPCKSQNRVALRHRHATVGALWQVLSLSGEEMWVFNVDRMPIKPADRWFAHGNAYF